MSKRNPTPTYSKGYALDENGYAWSIEADIQNQRKKAQINLNKDCTLEEFLDDSQENVESKYHCEFTY